MEMANCVRFILLVTITNENAAFAPFSLPILFQVSSFDQSEQDPMKHSLRSNSPSNEYKMKKEGCTKSLPNTLSSTQRSIRPLPLPPRILHQPDVGKNTTQQNGENETEDKLKKPHKDEISPSFDETKNNSSSSAGSFSFVDRGSQNQPTWPHAMIELSFGIILFVLIAIFFIRAWDKDQMSGNNVTALAKEFITKHNIAPFVVNDFTPSPPSPPLSQSRNMSNNDSNKPQQIKTEDKTTMDPTFIEIVSNAGRDSTTSIFAWIRERSADVRPESTIESPCSYVRADERSRSLDLRNTGNRGSF